MDDTIHASFGMSPFDTGSIRQSNAGPRTVVQRLPARISIQTKIRYIYIVDCDIPNREHVASVLECHGFHVRVFDECDSFLRSFRPEQRGCLLVDSMMLGLAGFDLIHDLEIKGSELPTIVMASNATFPMAVQAIRMGAFDFITKPLNVDILIERLTAAMAQATRTRDRSTAQRTAEGNIASLTVRQNQILKKVLAGNPSKNIAADLGISQRTVEKHRAIIGEKTGSRTLSALIKVALCANCDLPQRVDG